MNTTKVVPLRPDVTHPSPSRAAPRPSRRKAPPSHLDSAARRAWADILAGRPGASDPDEITIERAAVLLAYFREFAMNRSLVAAMNSLLSDIGLSPLARARVRDRPDQLEPARRDATTSLGSRRRARLSLRGPY
jgi:hypothetical protein